MGLPGPLGNFGWLPLCNRVEQTCGSVPCSIQETDADADRCIGRQVRAKMSTNLEWPSFSHTFILGEHTANINSLRFLPLRFFVIQDSAENEGLA
jgi:hypothetical protein